MATYRIIRVIGEKKEIIAVNLELCEAKKYETLYANVYMESEDEE